MGIMRCRRCSGNCSSPPLPSPDTVAPPPPCSLGLFVRLSVRLQDEIVSLVLAEDHSDVCPASCAAGSTSPGGSRKRDSPVALFTSGGMGAGKGHVLRQFLKEGEICLPKDFVW